MKTSTHMLWACMTVTPWSMIQPSNAGSVGTHGVAKPQPANGRSPARSSTAAQISSRPVRSALRPRAVKIWSRSSQSASAPPSPIDEVADVVLGALARTLRAAHQQHGHEHHGDARCGHQAVADEAR